MKRMICGTLIALAAVAAAVDVAIAIPQPPMFRTRVTLHSTVSGEKKIDAQAEFIELPGLEGRFFVGGRVELGSATEPVPHSAQIRSRVIELRDGRLKVHVYIGRSHSPSKDDSDVTFHEQGVHCVRTVRPGEAFEIDLGEGHSAMVSVIHEGRFR